MPRVLLGGTEQQGWPPYTPLLGLVGSSGVGTAGSGRQALPVLKRPGLGDCIFSGGSGALDSAFLRPPTPLNPPRGGVVSPLPVSAGSPRFVHTTVSLHTLLGLSGRRSPPGPLNLDDVGRTAGASSAGARRGAGGWTPRLSRCPVTVHQAWYLAERMLPRGMGSSGLSGKGLPTCRAVHEAS